MGLKTLVCGLLPHRRVSSWDLARWQCFLSNGQRGLLQSATPPGTAGPCQLPVCAQPFSTQQPTQPVSPPHTLSVALFASAKQTFTYGPSPSVCPCLPPSSCLQLSPVCVPHSFLPRSPYDPAPGRSELSCMSVSRREKCVNINIQPQESSRGGNAK